eukprot:3940994-Rhodomonas_salina.1
MKTRVCSGEVSVICHCDHKWQHCGHKWWVTCAVCEDEEQDKVGPGSSIVQVSTGRCVQIA